MGLLQSSQGEESDMRRRLQILEVLNEALSLLPKPKYYVPKFGDDKFEYVPNLRREPRADAQGFKKRRSKPNRQWESWVDVQTFTLQKETD